MAVTIVHKFFPARILAGCTSTNPKKLELKAIITLKIKNKTTFIKINQLVYETRENIPDKIDLLFIIYLLRIPPFKTF